jgi:hypothetical protein
MAITAMMISKKKHQKWFDGLMMVNWWVYDGFFIFIWLVVYQNPSEKWWTESQLGLFHSIPKCFWKVIQSIPWFQSPPTSILLIVRSQFHG